MTVKYVVALCDSNYKSLWLAILFGYKFIMQGVGVFLAFKIRKVKVSLYSAGCRPGLPSRMDAGLGKCQD